MATGDLVWIAEADDFAEPQFLARLVPCFDEPGTVLVYAESRQVGPGGEVLAASYREYVQDVDEERWRTSWRRSGHEEIIYSLSIKNTIPNVSAVLFRRDLLTEALSSDLEWISGFQTAGDWATYVSVLSRGGHVEFVAEPLNNHRRHKGGVVLGHLHASTLTEIERMQSDIRNRFVVPDEVVVSGDRYLQDLAAALTEVGDEARAAR